MSVSRRPNSPVYHYSFYVDGIRYRGSTKTSKLTEARTRESALMTKIEERGGTAIRRTRTPLLSELSVRFLAWVDSSRLEQSTKLYYKRGWKLLEATPLASMRVSTITGDDVAATRIMHQVEKEGEIVSEECSGHYTNRALRTLKRMLSKAVEWKIIADVPRFKLVKAYGRDTKIGQATEKILLDDLSKPITNTRNARMRLQIHDVMIVAQDTGMRPSEIFRIRVENVNFADQQIWNPYGKTDKARRFVTISNRMAAMLTVRCSRRKEGWVFASDRSKSGHITSIAKGFQASRARTGVNSKVVPYSARHTYGTYTLAATGNLFAVAGSMGHVDTKSMEPYQHHDLEMLREAINRRNEDISGFGHIFGHSGRKEVGSVPENDDNRQCL